MELRKWQPDLWRDKLRPSRKLPGSCQGSACSIDILDHLSPITTRYTMVYDLRIRDLPRSRYTSDPSSSSSCASHHPSIRPNFLLHNSVNFRS